MERDPLRPRAEACFVPLRFDVEDADRLRAGELLTLLFLAGVFLAEDFLADDDLTGDFRAGDFLALLFADIFVLEDRF